MQVSHRKTKETRAKQKAPPLLVALSGFDSVEKSEIKMFIEKLGNIIVEEDMTFKVRLVISNTVWSSKYKAAAILGLPVVSRKWVVDSFKQKRILPFDEYKLGFFSGIRIGLLGFNQEDQATIRDLVENEGGTVTTDIELMMKQDQQKPVIVMNRQSQYEYDNILNQFLNITCDVEWLRQCKLRKQFVPIENYLMNKVLEGDQIDKDIMYDKLLQPSLDNAFNNFKLEESCYLKDIIAYVHCKEEKIQSILHRYLSVANAYYLVEYSPLVTHVITMEAKYEPQWQNVHIVSPQWLMDSFVFKTKMVETDYKVHTKPIIGRLQFNSVETVVPRNSSSVGANFGLSKIQPFHGSKGFPLQPNTTLMNNNPTLTVAPRRSLSQNHFPIQTKLISKVKSTLFKGILFYIYEHSSNPKDLRQVIEEHDGQAHYFLKNYPDSRSREKASMIVIILPDSKETPSIIKSLEGLKHKRVFSSRWVYYCIEKHTLEVNILEKKLLTLQPVKYETPIRELMSTEIYISVKNVDDKVLFKEIVKILTGKYPTTFNPETVTVLVTDKQQSKKIPRISEAKIKSPKWLITVFQSGQITY